MASNQKAAGCRINEDFSTDVTYGDFSARHKRMVTFRAGETIVLFTARADGVYRIMRGDEVLDANLYRVGTAESCSSEKAKCAGIVTKAPVTRWWVMVMNAQKQSGWIEEPRHFTGAATCH